MKNAVNIGLVLIFLTTSGVLCTSSSLGLSKSSQKASQWETVKPICSLHDGGFEKESFRTINHKSVPTNLRSTTDILCTNRQCPQHSFCFLGACPCHPGYIGDKCDIKIDPKEANPWYTENCPNLQNINTFSIDTPLDQVGGEYSIGLPLGKGVLTAPLKSDSSPTGPLVHKRKTVEGETMKYTAYLCYSHASYGTAVVPKSLWLAAQTAEGNLWQEVGKYSLATDANDRAIEHWKAFGMFNSLTKQHIKSAISSASLASRSTNTLHQASMSDAESGKGGNNNNVPLKSSSGSLNLGRVIEVGAGPWTQFKGILHVRPDLVVEEFTIWEPGANRYMSEVPSCSYRNGKSLIKWEQTATTDSENLSEHVHPFPIKIVSTGGELLTNMNSIDSSSSNKTTYSNNGNENKKNSKKTLSSQQQQQQQQSHVEYDTLISINVLEHVQDAFQYLNGLYLSLKIGGILIMHERYYDHKSIPDGDLYHPVRIKRQVLDRFLSGFTIIFNNCSANFDNRPGEQGYYVIGVKI